MGLSDRHSEHVLAAGAPAGPAEIVGLCGSAFRGPLRQRWGRKKG